MKKTSKPPIPFTCPNCGVGLDDLESIVIDKTPGYRCKICETRFPVSSEHCQAIIRQTKTKEKHQNRSAQQIIRRLQKC